MINLLSIHTIRFVILILLQVLLLCHINFLGYVNPYPYILFVLLFPIKNNRLLFILLSFLLGLFLDMFLDSVGIHAVATLTIAYIRPVVLKFSFGAVYEHQTVKFSNVDFTQRITYISILAVIHHFILFSFEIFNFSKIILTLKNVLFSSIFTVILCLLITIIFSSKNKK